MAPTTFFVVSPFAIACYGLRRIELSTLYIYLALAVGLLLAAAGCWWRARASFFAPADARVLLESHLRLDSRLTAATEKLIAWPEAPATLPSIVCWRLRPAFGWISGAAALLAIAAFAPVPQAAIDVRRTSAPPSLVQLEKMLAAMKQLQVADPAALNQLGEQASALARRPTDEQYSHAALEAADALRDQTTAAIADLARDLNSAANALQSADSTPDMKAAAGQLAAAISGLRSDALPANRKLLSQLPSGEADLKNLTPEQRAALAGQLASASRQTGGVAGAAGANAPMAEPDPNARPGSGSGRGAGNGGPGGGGDTAPLALSEHRSEADPHLNKPLSAGSLQRVALGDKLGTAAGAHDVDPAKLQGPVSAGAVSTPASGGDAVWVNRLTPAERAALTQFFK